MSTTCWLRTAAAALPLVWTLTACGGSSGPVDGGAAMRHVEYLVNEIGPRPTGSEGLKKTTDYVCAELEKLGLKPQRQEWVDGKEKLTLRNVYCQIDGEDPENGPILAIGCHYDTKLTHGHEKDEHNFEFVGAIDGGGATGVLLELAKVIKETPRKVNVWLIFFDGEESIPFDWDNDRSLIGSKYFVKTMNGDKKLFPKGLNSRLKAFVLLDLIGDKNIKIDRDLNSNKKLQDLFAKAAKDMGEESRVYEFTSEFTDDHQPFTAFGIPAVLLIDFQFRIPVEMRIGYDPARKHPRDDDFAKWWHTDQDTLDKMSPDALAFAGNLVMKAFPDLESWVLNR